MFTTYILRSQSNPTQRYIGFTTDLRRRIEEHNSGTSSHTAKYLPWAVETCISFQEEKKAREFEKYLKSGSGHAFAKKHF